MVNPRCISRGPAFRAAAARPACRLLILDVFTEVDFASSHVTLSGQAWERYSATFNSGPRQTSTAPCAARPR